MPATRLTSPYFEIRKSPIQGRGAFATRRIRTGTRIIEYTGEHTPWDDAMDLPPRDPENPYHTFFFSLDNGDVIDAGRGATASATGTGLTPQGTGSS